MPRATAIALARWIPVTYRCGVGRCFEVGPLVALRLDTPVEGRGGGGDDAGRRWFAWLEPAEFRAARAARARVVAAAGDWLPRTYRDADGRWFRLGPYVAYRDDHSVLGPADAERWLCWRDRRRAGV